MFNQSIIDKLVITQSTIQNKRFKALQLINDNLIVSITLFHNLLWTINYHHQNCHHYKDTQISKIEFYWYNEQSIFPSLHSIIYIHILSFQNIKLREILWVSFPNLQHIIHPAQGILGLEGVKNHKQDKKTTKKLQTYLVDLTSIVLVIWT